MNKVTMVVFEGGRPKSEVEELVVTVRKAVVLDNLEKFSSLQELDRILLYTTYEDLACEAARYGVQAEFMPARGRFHFGQQLARVVEKHGLEAVLYLGGASGSLLEPWEVGQAARALASSRELLVTNNLFSSDIVGFSPASAVLDLADPPPSDNALAMALSSLPVMKMDETVGSTFDVDTPADVMVLGTHPSAGARARAAIQGLKLDPAYARLIRARDILATPLSEVGVIGRVSPSAVLHVNRNLKCRTRVFSEERGMKALGRQDRREVVSLLGFLVERVGFAGFASLLNKVADAVFMDSRVLFYHLGLDLPARDRFSSDLMRPEDIENPVAREFTRSVLASDIPIVLGGHCLVSGGLRALTDSVISLQKGEASQKSQQDS
ncbi:MAG: hypothetical protein AB1774_01975 [Bacillota bacterium]